MSPLFAVFLSTALLIAVSPAIPIALAVVVGGGAYGLYKWLSGDDKPAPVPGPTPPGPTPGPTPGPLPGPAPPPAPGDKLTCKATGQKYNSARWTGPDAVAGGLIRLGYTVGNTLVTASDKEQIRKFQRRVRQLKLGPYANAPESWIHGRMGPCGLISLSAAEAEFLAGNWQGA